jgi:hypothetical protein
VIHINYIMGHGTDDGTHGFRGGFISHPDALYYMSSFPFLVGKKLQCQTQQRDGVQPAISELPGCPSHGRPDG